MQDRSRTTRLAPSPTGGLHLGNARSFLLCWALGRKLGWKVLLRIEDLDEERCTPAHEKAIIESLRWLGIDWDDEPVRQSARVDTHRVALEQLDGAGLLFACDRSRRELRAAAEAAGAPHETGSNLVSTEAMRPEDPALHHFIAGDRNHRMKIEQGVEDLTDELLGTSRHDLAAEFGDPIVWTRKDLASYQLAVVVDDLAQGVTDVVRGDDLLSSAALQQRIARSLEGESPDWWHLPLVLDEHGERLSKRKDDQTLESMREEGIPAERVIGLLAMSCGMLERPEPMDGNDFLETIDPASLQAWARESSRRGGDRIDTTALSWLRNQ